MARKSYKQQIMALSGMSSAEYDKVYKNIQSRTANYNAHAGTDYSAAHVLYLRYRYPDDLSEGVKNIFATKASNPHTSGDFKETRFEALGVEEAAKTEETAKDEILKRWGKFFDKSEEYAKIDGSGDALKIKEMLENGEIAPYEANEMLKALKADAKERTKTNPAYKY